MKWLKRGSSSGSRRFSCHPHVHERPKRTVGWCRQGNKRPSCVGTTSEEPLVSWKDFMAFKQLSQNEMAQSGTWIRSGSCIKALVRHVTIHPLKNEQIINVHFQYFLCLFVPLVVGNGIGNVSNGSASSSESIVLQ